LFLFHAHRGIRKGTRKEEVVEGGPARDLPQKAIPKRFAPFFGNREGFPEEK